MQRVPGKVAIVTGAASGIGRAASVLLAREGASVALTDVNDPEGAQAAEEIQRQGYAAGYWHMDVTREEEITAVFSDVAAYFGKIDVLVNNAAVSGPDRPPDRVTREEWDQVLAVNTAGPFLCTRQAIPYMRRAGGGSIINLSSVDAFIGGPDLPPYHAAKAALAAMSKNDALYYAGDHIRVNSLHPAAVMTPMLEAVAARSGQDRDQWMAEVAAMHALNRIARPEEIAWGIVFLASDESSFVTGSALIMDGGYTAR
ncbi:MAG: SDR family oxidoreductase [Candidatus Zixiibacteriota bacterium]|nr:MAG: SDR family oxidoreductase [candidate division Zixibacteria bacterium]